MTDRLPPVVQIAERTSMLRRNGWVAWWSRFRHRIGILSCAVGIHQQRLYHEGRDGRLGAKPQFVEVLRCWRCGRYA